MTEAEAAQIGPYQLIDKLGEGGMGTVYRGVHVETGVQVALKTVRQLRATFLSQIQREIHVLSQLQHPGIVSIIEHGLHQGQPWYAMDFVPGVTLRHYCFGLQAQEAASPSDPSGSKKRSNESSHDSSHEPDTLFDLYESPTMQLGEEEDPLATSLMLAPTHSGSWWTYMLQQEPGQAAAFAPPPTLEALEPLERVQRIMRMLRRLCVSLSYLHGQGLVHCDIKPGNILIRHDEWPVLIDFGLLMQFTGRAGRESIAERSLGRGTPAYMSPEQIDGSLLDARTDLYSLGCVLFEMLTGSKPFQGTEQEIMEQHRKAIPEAPSRRAEGIPPALDQVVLRLMAKKPQERIGYADAVKHLISKLVPPDMNAPDDWREALETPATFYLYRPGFVSRPALLSQMESLWRCMGPADAAVDENLTPCKPIWLFEGESGVGKTRMFLEVARRGHQQGRLVLTGESLDHHSPPFEGVMSCLRTIAAKLAGADDDAVLAMLGPHGRALLPYEPTLEGLRSSAALPSLPELPPNQMRELVHTALHHALTAMAQEQPLLLLVDDLQWADALTLGFFHFVQSKASSFSPGPPPILLIGSYRSEAINESLERLRSHPTAERVVLERFDEEGVGLLVKDMLALPSSPRMFSQFLARHSEGNPFFVAEYLRSAVESGLLWRHPQGRWHIGNKGLATDLDPDEETLPLPDSLREQVARRLRDLSPHGSMLVAAAAVVDRELTYAMLESLTRLAQYQLWDALEELQRKQILLTSPENTLRFAHDKLREVAYDSLSDEHRRQLHAQAAEVLEQMVDTHSSARFGTLAMHLERAGEHMRALGYYKQAAELAEQQHDNEEAIRLYAAYIELDPLPTQETVEVQLAMGNIQRLSGKVDDAEASFKRTWSMAKQLDLTDLEGQAQSSLGLLYWSIGKAEESVQAHQSALALYRQTGNRSSEGATLGDLATNHFLSGEISQAQALFAEALTIHYETGNERAQAKDMSNLAGIYLEQGDFQTSRKMFETALALVEQVGPKHYRHQMLNNLAHVYQYQGDWNKAQSLYQQSYDLATAQGDRRGAGMALGNLAALLRDMGLIEEAREAFQEAIQLHRDVKNVMFEAVAWIDLLMLDRLYGQNLVALKASLHKIEVLLRNASDTPYMALLLCEMGHIQLAQGFDANDRVEAATTLMASAHVTVDSPTQLGIALARLLHAQEAASQGVSLFRGQRVEDIPHGLLQRLSHDGHLPSEQT